MIKKARQTHNPKNVYHKYRIAYRNYYFFEAILNGFDIQKSLSKD